jgi:hypothetical protein
MTLLPDGRCSPAAAALARTASTSRSRLPAEIWNPDTETWTEVDALQNGRQYHSTALLLPDGRVLMAGGGAVGGAPDIKNGEIYSPPYLFKGTAARDHVVPGDDVVRRLSFDVNTPNAAQIAHVSLIRSPSVTHAFDMNQRFQFLNFTQGSGKVTGDRTGEREPRAARRLSALPRRHERRAVVSAPSSTRTRLRSPGDTDASHRFGDGRRPAGTSAARST